MNAQHFLLALNEIDGKYIRRADVFAEADAVARRRAAARPLLRWSVGLAAGLALAVGLLSLARPWEKGLAVAGDSASSSAAMAEGTEEGVQEQAPDAAYETAESSEAEAEEAPGALPSLPAEEQLIYDSENHQLAADIAMPEGGWSEELTEEQLASLLGNAQAARPEWRGRAVYLADGSPWMVSLSGSVPYQGGAAQVAEIELSPGALPPTCTPFPFTVTCKLWGVPVAAHRSVTGGETVWLGAEFLTEGEEPIGVRVSLSPWDGFPAGDAQAMLEALLTRCLSPESTLSLSGLRPAAQAAPTD